MIRKFKKIAIIFLATIIIFTGSIAIPHEEQKANAMSIPLALQGAAGVYVLGGLLVAAGVGAVGYDEYSDDIKEHALRAWDNASAATKASFDFMIESARATQGGLTALHTIAAEWLAAQGKMDMIYPVSDMSSLGVMGSAGGSWGSKDDGSITAVFNMTYTLDAGNLFVNGSHTSTTLTFRENSTKKQFELTGPGISETWSYNDRDVAKRLSIAFHTQNVGQFMAAFMAYSGSSIGLSIGGVESDIPTAYNDLSRNYDEAWTSMRDAGLVLPVDNFVPVSSAGEPLTYNPATGELTGIDGGVYTGDYTWEIPNIKWRDKSAAVPEAGAWVETPVSVPGVGVGNPAIPNTITNITTGTTVLNPDIPIEGDLPGGGTPPPAETENPWNRPPTKKPPNIGALVTTKFPFSLPFDFFGVLGWLNAEPKAPVFKLDTGLNTPFGKEVKMDMEFKFDFLDPYMGYFRSFIIIGFSLFLILATRKLMGGAG